MKRNIKALTLSVLMTSTLATQANQNTGSAANAPVPLSPLEIKAKKDNRERIINVVILDVMNQLKEFDKTSPPLRADLGEHLLNGQDGYKDGEAAATQKATVDVIKTVMNRAFDGQTPGISKGDHGKSLACLKGQIKFHDRLSDEARRGVVVPGAIYEVESRISNAEDPGRSDRSSTSQGVALKLKNVSKIVGDKDRLPDFLHTDEQDFLMTSAPTFFLSDVVEYSLAFGLRAGDKVLPALPTILTSPAMLTRLGVEIGAKLRTWSGYAPGDPKNIMTHPYWSKHPYAWGDVNEASLAAKYSVAPCGNIKNLTLKSNEENYQKTFINEAFQKNGQICFQLRVQLRPKNAKESELPIENSYIEWKEKQLPFETVATVTFPASRNQNWASEESQKACARTEFTPWNGLTAHQPLSNLARARRYVYKASALVRESKAMLDAKINAAK